MRLITASLNDGTVQVCDAKCYDAEKGSKCKCCCGGLNHSVGMEQALVNMHKEFGSLAYEEGGVRLQAREGEILIPPGQYEMKQIDSNHAEITAGVFKGRIVRTVGGK